MGSKKKTARVSQTQAVFCDVLHFAGDLVFLVSVQPLADYDVRQYVRYDSHDDIGEYIHGFSPPLGVDSRGYYYYTKMFAVRQAVCLMYCFQNFLKIIL